MHTQRSAALFILLILILVTSACALTGPRETPAPTAQPALPSPTPLPTMGSLPLDSSQPIQISGQFQYSNDFVVETYFVEHAVALVDMRGFVLRDSEWLIPVESQTLGFVKIDREKKQGDFWLQLPAQPAAVYSDVDNDGNQDTGLQIFALAYWPNLAGGPYSEGDDPSRGWPSYLASVKTDTENQDEVTGGQLVIWSPDDSQQFPTGFGADGLLFTADDPLATVPPGYSIINLDQQPFGITREREPRLTLYEPSDVAIKDFSSLSYAEAFDRLFNIVRKEYAFNGVQGKQPDWDTLYAQLQPKIQDAQSKGNGYLYYQALMQFVYAFKDGHVGISGGQYDARYNDDFSAGGFGLAARELDDDSVIVTFVLPGSPAASAGIQTGDLITSVNGKPVGQAIGEVQPLSAPHSSDFALRYQQVRYLLRGKVGAKISLAIQDQTGAKRDVNLTAVSERASLNASSLYKNYDPNVLPVEYRILDSGLGYVRVNSNYDDLGLIVRLFLRALQTFQANQLGGVIIDMRQNFGGSPLGLAGFFTDEVIELGQLEYYSEKTGQFEPEGQREKVYPNQEQFRFNKVALLVDQTCFSACEIEAYAFSKLPGVIVIGQYPTAGVEAEVARGQFLLPDGMSMQIPTGRFTLPDGSLMLEGTGVIPTLRIPIDRDTVFSEDDVVLKAAETALE